MRSIFRALGFCFLLAPYGYGQSPSFRTYTNPVIPGDHPDCTLTKVGNDYYTTGSSFNPTPVIYHSTDLIHWEAIAQPVSAAWSGYGDSPGGGCWGGQIVYYNNKYWDFFGRSFVMYFVTADKPEGPWSTPTLVSTPSGVPGLGADNSIFIDDDGTWYLLVKNGQVNNWIVQLGSNGQPQGAIYDLRWINPSPSFPYSWAEGPVMWKYHGYYYYSFARDVSGGQKVMRSKTLTATQSSWQILGDFFYENDPAKYQSLFQNPNHSSAAVILGDSTSWVIHPNYHRGVSNEWMGQGRQGLVSQVRYDASDKPTADYPDNKFFVSPNLPSSGIPWMVPKSDFFSTSKLNPEWSFLGYTPASLYSLVDQPGWLRLSPKSGKINTIIKNDGEHNYSLITRLNFNAQSLSDEAGLIILRGDEKSFCKLYYSINDVRHKAAFFSYNNTKYEAENSAAVDTVVWLKMVRVNHIITGYFSSNGSDWVQVGQPADVSAIDSYSDPSFAIWEGTRQGLYVQNSPALFDLYIYRDAYTPILAECPANQFGTTRTVQNSSPVLDNIYYNDWSMYAGVEFGNPLYQKSCDSVTFTASSAVNGGLVEVYIDSIEAGRKIAECSIGSTGSWTTYQSFSAKLSGPVSGNHDVYLLFTGSVSDKLFMLQSFYFTGTKSAGATSVKDLRGDLVPQKYILDQNYPNPFNPSTTIPFGIPRNSFVSLKVYSLLGKEIAELAGKQFSSGWHSVTFDAPGLASGAYFYTLMVQESNIVESKKMFYAK